MNLLRRWTTLKSGMGQHCPTRWLRPIRHAVLVVSLMLVSACAGFLLSHPEVDALIVENKVLEVKVQECNGFLNGNVKMLDASSGEVYAVVKTKVKLIEGLNQGEIK